MMAWLDERAAEQRLRLAAVALGVALGGQFASLAQQRLPGWLEPLLFTLLIGSLFVLWQRRALLSRLAGRRLAGAVLLGFGGFQLADMVLIGWLMGGTLPELRDLWWPILFGFGALLLGTRLLQPGRGPGRRGGGWRHAGLG